MSWVDAFHDPKGTFSISESEERLRPSSISGGVKARRSFCVTFSSVKEMFPEGMSSSDHGEMIKPNADGSVEPEVKKNMHYYHKLQFLEHGLNLNQILEEKKATCNFFLSWMSYEVQK